MFNSPSKYQDQRKNKGNRKRWQLFQATDFQSLMYPCFTSCRILGIFPYKLKASTFEISRSQYILSTVITCICCICVLKVLIMLYHLNIFRTISMTRIPAILEANCFYILSGFITIVTYILSSRRMRLLQSVMEISSRLPPKSYQKLSRLIHTKDILGFFYLIGHSPIYLFVLHIDVFFKIYNIYIMMMMFQMDMLYMNCVCILKACFKSMNNNLAHIQKFVVKSERHVLGLIYHKQQNLLLLLKFKALRKQHLKISDTIQMLNMIFGSQLLATILLTFLEIAYSLYFYILWWQEEALMINLKIHFVFFIPYTVYLFIKIILIIWACETHKNQVLQINTSIHDVFNSTTDEQIKNELLLFSLQILHCKNTFSMKGLTVDAKLLTEIVGGITTYVLILMQFLQMQNSCDQKTPSNITLLY